MHPFFCELFHFLFYFGVLSLIYVIVCQILKPLGALPKALAEALEAVIIMVYQAIAMLIHYATELLKGTIPVIFEHILKLITALFLFVVRAFTFLINGIVWLLNKLFRWTTKSA